MGEQALLMTISFCLVVVITTYTQLIADARTAGLPTRSSLDEVRPWFGSLHSLSSGHLVCSAILASDRTAITPAHCINPEESYYVVFGDVHANSTSRTVRRVSPVVHPEYTEDRNYDVALLHMDKSVPTSQGIAPANFTDIRVENPSEHFSQCWIAKWVKDVTKITEEPTNDCLRNCTRYPTPRVCRYNFLIQFGEAFSKDCGRCPQNSPDCRREGCIPLDGNRRKIVTVNGMMPGPTINVCQGDNIIVNVVNDMNDTAGTTLHWHGLHQRHTQNMDGVPYITQCPTGYRDSMLYNFTASEAGTHYWHSHVGLQREDGLVGALVIRQADDIQEGLYDFDLPEHTILLLNWLPEMSDLQEPVPPTSILINGRATIKVDKIDYISERAEFDVEAGFRYRFRIIGGMVMNCPLVISVDNHTFNVIASDGQPVQSYPGDTLVVYAGERYDVVLDANQPVGCYWFRAVGLEACREVPYELAIIRYNQIEAMPDLPEEFVRTGVQLNPLNMKSTPDLVYVSSLKPAENNVTFINESITRYYLGMDFTRIQNPSFPSFGRTVQIDNSSFMMPPLPLLTDWSKINPTLFCENVLPEKNCSSEFCQCIKVIKAPLNQVVELVMVNEALSERNATHPFHLHGHHFWVVAMDKLGHSTSVDHVKSLVIKLNLQDPPLKDTVMIPTGGYTVIRFMADNPGWWFFHCHWDIHLEMGMALVFRVGDDSDLPRGITDRPACHSTDEQDRSLITLEGQWTTPVSSSNCSSFELTDVHICVRDTPIAAGICSEPEAVDGSLVCAKDDGSFELVGLPRFRATSGCDINGIRGVTRVSSFSDFISADYAERRGHVLPLADSRFFLISNSPEISRRKSLYIYAINRGAPSSPGMVEFSKDGALTTNTKKPITKHGVTFGHYLKATKQQTNLGSGRYKVAYISKDGSPTPTRETFVRVPTRLLDTQGVYTITIYPVVPGEPSILKPVSVGINRTPGFRKVVWSRDNESRVVSFGPRFYLTSTDDAGLYTLRRRSRGLRGLIVQLRVIAGVCPEGQYLISLDPVTCTSVGAVQCKNGGVLNQEANKCTCPPFFGNSDCGCAVEPYQGDPFVLADDGGMTALVCSDLPGGNHKCRGHLICYGANYGCKCSSGWWGNACKKPCWRGRYGPSCEQHCPETERDCSRFFGPSTNRVRAECDP